MASPLEDLTRLLAGLASGLSHPPSAGAGDSLSASISSLAAALNPDAASGTRVLDAALSLMCFDSLDVDRARVDCLVRTIVPALSASVSCRVVRPNGGGAELLCVGSSVSPGACRELVRSCAALLEKLGDCDDMGTIAADLKTHPSYQVLPSDRSVPLRVLLWHLDPSILKHDLSAMLQEAIRRPLLCLRKELHARMAWHVILICLVCSPPMFMEMRSLFHIWFLSTRFLDLVSYIDTTVYLGKTRTSRSLWKNLQSQPSKGHYSLFGQNKNQSLFMEKFTITAIKGIGQIQI